MYKSFEDHTRNQLYLWRMELKGKGENEDFKFLFYKLQYCLNI